MPTISSKLSAHLVDQTKARTSWVEIELSTTGGPTIGLALTNITASLQKSRSVNTKLSAYLVVPPSIPDTITTSFDAAIRKSSASRDLSSAVQVSIEDDQLEVFFAVDLEFDSGNLHFWTGLGTKTINGEEYTGTGYLLDISSIEETSEISAKGAKLVLSGIPTVLLGLSLTEPYQGRHCHIYFGIESDTPELTELFTGYMDQMNLFESSNTASIELTVENKLVDLEKPRIARFTSAYQKSIYSGDLGLDFVEDLQDKRLNWGRA